MKTKYVIGFFSCLLLAAVLLTAGYEAVREISRRYDNYAKNTLEGRRDGDDMSECSSSVYPGCEIVISRASAGPRQRMCFL